MLLVAKGDGCFSLILPNLLALSMQNVYRSQSFSTIYIEIFSISGDILMLNII